MIIVGLFIIITACSAQKTETKVVTNQPDISFTLDQTKFTVTSWKLDNSHLETVTGRLLVDEEPVKDAIIQVTNKRTLKTNERGEFSVVVSRNRLDYKQLQVMSVSEATIKGKALNEVTKKSLVGAEVYILVYYPIEIEKVVVNQKDKTLVDVHAKAILSEGHKYPAFGPEKFKVGGTVKDASGTPVEGATVNLRRDGVEGFTMSEPSDQDGIFTMYYLPEDDENHYFYVHHQGITYTLPPKKVFLFPEDASVNIDITLPEKGTIITDKAPYLVTTTAPGALYKGTLIGVNVAKDVKYRVTIPKEDGTFIVTIAKKEWDKQPTFFETNFSQFLLKAKQSGDRMSSERIPKVKPNEPNEVVAD